MQDMLGSVRRSLVFRTSSQDGEDSPSPIGVGGGPTSTFVEKINSCIRKSRVFSKPSPPLASLSPSPPPMAKDNTPPIRWRKGELIGCGAFGRVYMGMNLDSGELLAVKQVLIAANTASKKKTQAHIKELEEEVKLLKNLSHPNIVRYLGTVTEEETLNILLEFVPGGSISSLLGKFGSFPEAVVRTYTKQLLLGLSYLHKNGIMHRDIKGANILVDNKGCIKLADFGASKQVVELATISGAKSMKGTPYWMAPEVILQTGHSFSADIWSVGCTVIEMATGKPPWSQQFQEMAALFHIGTTKSHPPIPEQLSVEAKDFLLKCLQKEPNLRPAASELLQHPFVTGEPMESHHAFCTSMMENSETSSPSNTKDLETYKMVTCLETAGDCNLGSLNCSTVSPEKSLKSKHLWRINSSNDDMCQIDDSNDISMGEGGLCSSLMPDNFKSFNPISEPSDDWVCKLAASPEAECEGINLDPDQKIHLRGGCSETFNDRDKDFSFHCRPSLSEDDEELTESKIRAFLDEKILLLALSFWSFHFESLCAFGLVAYVGYILYIFPTMLHFHRLNGLLLVFILLWAASTYVFNVASTVLHKKLHKDMEIWETIGLWHYPIPGFYLLAQFGLGVLVALGNLVNNSVLLHLSDRDGPSTNNSSSVEEKEETLVYAVATIAWGVRKSSRAVVLALTFLIATKPGFIHAIYMVFFMIYLLSHSISKKMRQTLILLCEAHFALIYILQLNLISKALEQKGSFLREILSELGLLNQTSAADFLEIALLACFCSMQNHGFDMLSSFSAIVQQAPCPPIGFRTLRAGLIKSVLLSVYSSTSKDRQQINSSRERMITLYLSAIGQKFLTIYRSCGTYIASMTIFLTVYLVVPNYTSFGYLFFLLIWLIGRQILRETRRRLWFPLKLYAVAVLVFIYSISVFINFQTWLSNIINLESAFGYKKEASVLKNIWESLAIIVVMQLYSYERRQSKFFELDDSDAQEIRAFSFVKRLMIWHSEKILFLALFYASLSPISATGFLYLLGLVICSMLPKTSRIPSTLFLIYSGFLAVIEYLFQMWGDKAEMFPDQKHFYLSQFLGLQFYGSGFSGIEAGLRRKVLVIAACILQYNVFHWLEKMPSDDGNKEKWDEPCTLFDLGETENLLSERQACSSLNSGLSQGLGTLSSERGCSDGTSTSKYMYFYFWESSKESRKWNRKRILLLRKERFDMQKTTLKLYMKFWIENLFNLFGLEINMVALLLAYYENSSDDEEYYEIESQNIILEPTKGTSSIQSGFERTMSEATYSEIGMILRYMWGQMRSNNDVVCYCCFLLIFLWNFSLLSMVYIMALFLYALCINTGPSYMFWVVMLIYTEGCILLQYVYQIIIQHCGFTINMSFLQELGFPAHRIMSSFVTSNLPLFLVYLFTLLQTSITTKDGDWKTVTEFIFRKKNKNSEQDEIETYSYSDRIRRLLLPVKNVMRLLIRSLFRYWKSLTQGAETPPYFVQLSMEVTVWPDDGIQPERIESGINRLLRILHSRRCEENNMNHFESHSRVRVQSIERSPENANIALAVFEVAYASPSTESSPAEWYKSLTPATDVANEIRKAKRDRILKEIRFPYPILSVIGGAKRDIDLYAYIFCADLAVLFLVAIFYQSVIKNNSEFLEVYQLEDQFPEEFVFILIVNLLIHLSMRK